LRGLCHTVAEELWCVVASGFIGQRTLVIQGNTITLSPADAAAAADDDDDDDDDDDGDDVQDEMLLRTVIVHDVSVDMEDLVSVYLENPRKNGGPIESTSYDEDTKQLTVRFDSQQGPSALRTRYVTAYIGGRFVTSHCWGNLPFSFLIFCFFFFSSSICALTMFYFPCLFYFQP